MNPILTYEITLAAGWVSMRKAGRAEWNEDDFDAAARLTNRFIDITEARNTASNTTKTGKARKIRPAPPRA